MKVGYGGVRLNAIEMQDSLKKLLDIINDILMTSHDDIKRRGFYNEYEEMKEALRKTRDKIEKFVNTIEKQVIVENERGKVLVDWLGRKSAIMSKKTEEKFLSTRFFTGSAVIAYIEKKTDFPIEVVIE